MNTDGFKNNNLKINNMHIIIVNERCQKINIILIIINQKSFFDGYSGSGLTIAGKWNLKETTVNKK